MAKLTNKQDGLTDKQEGYLYSMLSGLSQREAYKENYNCENMSDKTIDEAACRLLANSKVNTRWIELTTKVREKAEEEGLLTAIDVLRKMSELIERNEYVDDRIALNGLKTYGKHHKLFTDKVEVAVTEMPDVLVKRG